jgi:hypothetical protein
MTPATGPWRPSLHFGQWLADAAEGVFVLDVAICQAVVADYMRESMAGILAAA